MPNAGYPDDDGSRTPSGQHDEGRQRQSCYDGGKFLRAAVISDMEPDGDCFNNQTCSTGDVFAARPRYPVDGDANTTPGRALGAYPSYVSAK